MPNKIYIPLVSIVTIGLNEAEHIEQTIRSVICQTYDHVEHIIIDGGSTDGTLEIIRRYSEHIEYWETGLDDGISDAFNRGVQRASGDFIAMLNAGDWYNEQTVASVMRHAEAHPKKEVFYGDVAMVRSDGTTHHLQKGVPNLSSKSFAFQMPAIPHPTVFARRELYIREPFDIRLKYAMDYDWLRRTYKQAHSFFYITEPSPLAYMRIEGKSNASYDDTLKEVYEITVKHGDSRMWSYIYNYVFRIARYKLRLKMEEYSAGRSLVDAYRKILVKGGLRNWEMK